MFLLMLPNVISRTYSGMTKMNVTICLLCCHTMKYPTRLYINIFRICLCKMSRTLKYYALFITKDQQGKKTNKL